MARRPANYGPALPSNASRDLGPADADEESTTIDQGAPQPDGGGPPKGGRYALHRGMRRLSPKRRKQLVEQENQRRTVRGPAVDLGQFDGEGERTFVEDDESSLSIGDDSGEVLETGRRDPFGGESELSTMDEPTNEGRERRARQQQGMGALHRREPAREPAVPNATGKLAVISGNDNGRTFDLDTARITVGRAIDNDIVLTDIAVSRRHMTITFDGVRYTLCDAGSGNGTLINDGEEVGDYALSHGDRLELGNTVMQFEHLASQQVVPSLPVWSKQNDLEAASTQLAPEPGAPMAAPQSADSRPVARPPSLPARRSRATLPPPHRGLGAPGAPGAPGRSVPVTAPLPPGPPPPPPEHLNSPMASPPSPGSFAPNARPPNIDGRPVMDEGKLPPHLVPEPNLRFPQPSMGSDSASFPGNSYVPGMGSRPGSLGPMFAQTGSEMMYPGDLRSPRRPLVIGLVLTVLVGAAAAVVIYLVRGDRGEVADNVAVTETTADAAPDASAPIAKVDIPRATWGNDEPLFTAVKGTVGKPDVPPIDAPDPVPEIVDAGVAPPDPPVDANDTTPNVEDEPIRTTDKPKPPKPPRPRRPKPPRDDSRSIVNAARKRATGQYKDKEFGAAARTVREAADKVRGRDATSLNRLSNDYDSLSTNFSEGQRVESSNPTKAIGAYQRAYRIDQRLGKAHTSFLRARIGSLAPKVAKSYLDKKQYARAKNAADVADRFGAGGAVSSVRTRLEKVAESRFREALKLKRKEPQKAKAFFNDVLRMVPPSSQWHKKSQQQLASM